VLYLIFNEGYTASSGSELHRPDLAREAIRLARMVHAQLPEDGEVTGLLALMLLTHARREVRTTAAGDLVPLDEQDRTKWDRGMIDEGIELVKASLAGLALLSTLDSDERMAGHHRLLSVRAHLLEKTGDTAGACEYYRRAAKSTASIAEQRYLESRASQVRP
jgi:predicted RNA polymerase sigma factor